MICECLPFDYPAPGIITNPTLPFKSYFSYGLQPGSIFVCGKRTKESKSCTLYLHSNSIKLWLTIDFINENLKCLANNWDVNEKLNSLNEQNEFEIILLVEQTRFRTAVNGKEVLNSTNKISLISINNFDLEIDGDINITKIFYDAGRVGKFAAIPFLHPSSSQEVMNKENIKPIFFPALPAIPIEGGLYKGKRIQICGISSALTKWFNIQLTYGPETSKEIPFHFGTDFYKKVVFLNSKIQKNWRPAIFHHEFPFEIDVNFDLLIYCAEKCFKVAINGKHFIDFPYQTFHINKIHTLFIEGKVNVTYVLIH